MKSPAAYALRRLLEAILAAVLLVAAELKAEQIRRGLDIGWLGTWPTVLLIHAELLLGIWLLMGGWARRRHLAALGCFFSFALVATLEAIRGQTDCGCFGPKQIPPYATAIFDGLAVLALWVTWQDKYAAAEATWPRLRLRIGIILIAALAGIFWSCYFRKPAPPAHNPSSRPSILVVVRSAGWPNKPFQLFDEIIGSDPLRHGRWLVVFYHYSCDICQEAVENYKKLAGSDSSARIAFIALPPVAPDAKHDPAPDVPGSGYLRLNVMPDTHWSTTPPIAAALEDGKVLMTAEGLDAIQPLVVPQWKEERGKP